VGSVGLGLLLSAGALGSVLGTAVVARLGSRERGRSLLVVSVLLPVLVMAFALADRLWLACLFLVCIGTALLIVQSLTITLVQIHIPDRVRGRVMSLYSQLHAGSDTMGNVAVGSLAVFMGLPLALLLGGAAAVVYAVGLSFMMPSVRRLD
jgi:MFS family permease